MEFFHGQTNAPLLTQDYNVIIDNNNVIIDDDDE